MALAFRCKFSRSKLAGDGDYLKHEAFDAKTFERQFGNIRYSYQFKNNYLAEMWSGF